MCVLLESILHMDHLYDANSGDMLVVLVSMKLVLMLTCTISNLINTDVIMLCYCIQERLVNCTYVLIQDITTSYVALYHACGTIIESL